MTDKKLEGRKKKSPRRMISNLPKNWLADPSPLRKRVWLRNSNSIERRGAMMMNQRWMMMLILLFVGTMIISGCTASRETVMAYNEAKETFQRATIADAKKCAPCQYGTAEGYLALADHDLKYYWRGMEGLEKSSKIVQDKSSEALKLTPCEKP